MIGPSGAGARLAARLAARTAHDLNNIAAIFSGHIYLMRSGAESSDEALEAMEKALEHIELLARGLTALGALGLEAVETIDVNEVLRSAFQETSSTGVELDLDPALPPVATRRRDLVRAVTALVQNAREAGGAGQAIRVITRSDHGIEISVEDTGAGVSAEVRRRNFDPLFSTKGEKGRGIGVTLAQAFAAIQAGSLSIEVRPEGGTRVRLRLPATRDE